MKLELKHLAPYLPYGLKIRSSEGSTIIIGYNIVNGAVIYQLDTNDDSGDFAFDDPIKPILRPLNDLIKDQKFLQFCKEQITGANIKIIYDDLNSTIIVYVLGGENVMIALCNEIAAECPYLFYQWLVENHYDIFDLIQNKLAIDINIL